MFFKERPAVSKRYQYVAASERKCAADIFVCVAALENISCFLRNIRLLLKDINVRLLLKEDVQLLLRIMST